MTFPRLTNASKTTLNLRPNGEKQNRASRLGIKGFRYTQSEEKIITRGKEENLLIQEITPIISCFASTCIEGISIHAKYVVIATTLEGVPGLGCISIINFPSLLIPT